MTPIEIIEKYYNKSKNLKIQNIDKNIVYNVDILIKFIDSNKSLVSALVTSLIKKIENPEQDIRFTRTDFVNGYSARVLDTHVTAPFFKKYFPKYANKESSFLTLATREKIPWTIEEGQNLKIRNQELKNAFLNIFDNIQRKKGKPEKYLLCILYKLAELSENDEKVFNVVNETIDNIGILNINIIIEMLKEHFSMKHGSRLPVIAIYTAYQELFKAIKRYSDKILLPLNVHTSSDKHGFGDIEIYTTDEEAFEIIEIKHNIPIDRYLIFDILKKSQNTNISRYYILTTHPDNFISFEEEKYISDLVLKIKYEHNIEIIANGIINSLKYYLRFIDDYHSFIMNYTKNLIEDSKHSTEIKILHIEKWNEIIKKRGIIK